jgi:hypothetical protein
MVPYGFRRTSSRLITITMAMATATTSSPTMAPRLNVSRASGCYGNKRGSEKQKGELHSTRHACGLWAFDV